MKFEIEAIETGWLLTLDGDKYAYDDFSDILSFIQDQFDPGSRHDAERIYIVKAPGDKHPDFTPDHAKLIWGDDESSS